jgi:hypothetical protein
MKSGKRSGMQNMSCGRTFHVLVATDTSTRTVSGYLGDRYEPGSQVTARRASNRILDGKTIMGGLRRSTSMPMRHVYSVRKKSWLSYQRERCNRIQNDHVIVTGKICEQPRPKFLVSQQERKLQGNIWLIAMDRKHIAKRRVIEILNTTPVESVIRGRKLVTNCVIHTKCRGKAGSHIEPHTYSKSTRLYVRE